MKSRAMRYLAFVLLASLVGCSSSEDSVSTDDGNELNEGIGVIDRAIATPIAVPESDALGVTMSAVLEEASEGLRAAAPTTSGGCSLVKLFDAADALKIEHTTCAGSETIRILAANGTTAREHADLDNDGKVDRWSSEEGVIAQIADTDFDGKVDVLVERVALVDDFSLAGYDVEYPKSSFLFRVREDRNHDGRFEFEKLTARGALAK